MRPLHEFTVVSSLPPSLEPLVGLAAIANLGMGVAYFIAKLLSLGQGVVTAASYEYGNTFLIVSGLLNMLVAIDAYDVRLGRK